MKGSSVFAAISRLGRHWGRLFCLPGLLWLSLLLLLPGSVAGKTFCFDLEFHPQLENLPLYDFTVLDPSAEVDLTPAHQAGKQAFAYISVGEIASDAWYLDEALAVTTILATNADWGSLLVDVRDPAWAQFVAQRLAQAAVDKGFDGFFLDTIDTMDDLAEADPDNADAFLDGMAALVNNLKVAFPTKEIIANRGLEIYDQIRNSIAGVLVESMFQTRDADGFLAQDPDVTHWLNEDLHPIKAGGTPIYVLDYCDPTNLPLAELTARKIHDLGYNALVMPATDGNVLASFSAEGPPLPPLLRPIIVTGPESSTVAAGGSVTFTVTAVGHGLTYQWRRQGIDVPGMTSPTLSLSNAQPGDAGSYSVLVSNPAGSATSDEAELTVTVPPPSAPLQPTIRAGPAGMLIGLRGQRGITCRIQVSDDLAHWNDLGRFVFVDESSEFNDPSSLPSSRRFYRLLP